MVKKTQKKIKLEASLNQNEEIIPMDIDEQKEILKVIQHHHS